MHEKDLRISRLLDFYKDILTDNKRVIMQLYYYDDYSLSEISELFGITRQGVRDAIKKSEKQLSDLEEKLGIVRRFKDMEISVSECITCLRDLSEVHDVCGSVAGSLSDIADDLEKAMNDMLA